MFKRFFSASCILTAVVVLAVSLAGISLKGSPNTADQPKSWGFDPANLDKSCKPCDNFYEFAMGGWMKANPIPAEYPSWGTFTQLRDGNLTAMRSILDAAAAEKTKAGTDAQKIGDFYASCMDTTAIDA